MHARPAVDISPFIPSPDSSAVLQRPIPTGSVHRNRFRFSTPTVIFFFRLSEPSSISVAYTHTPTRNARLGPLHRNQSPSRRILRRHRAPHRTRGCLQRYLRCCTAQSAAGGPGQNVRTPGRRHQCPWTPYTGLQRRRLVQQEQ